MHRLIEGCAQPASQELQPLVAGRRIFDRKQSTRQRRPWAKDFTHGSSRRAHVGLVHSKGPGN